MSPISRHEIDYRFVCRMRTARIFRDMTQQQVADAAGLHRHVIVSLEGSRRHVRLGEAAAIAAALGWPLQAFLDDEPLHLAVEVAP